MFDALLAELEDLKDFKKSMSNSDGDAIIPTAGTNTGDGDGDAVLGKSLTVFNKDGEEIPALDGTEMVKALTARLEKQEEDFNRQGDDLAKSLTAITGIIKDQVEVIKEQGSLIKSLQQDITALRSIPAGRKSVLTINDKPDPASMHKSQQEGMSGQEFMTKAMSAQKDGRLTATEVAIAESSLQKSLPVPADIVNKVLQQ
jgi:hypothetical protein